MKIALRRAVWMALLCVVAMPCYSQNRGSSPALDQVLSRMEALGKGFSSFSADFSQRKYIAVLKEFENPESGIFIYARAKDGSALLRQEFKAPGRRVLTIKGGTATIYQPAINQASVVSLGKNRDKAEFLALGIGQSPARMRETFQIEYQGEEKVDGAACSVLVLKPKSSSTAAFLSSITLWIDKASSLPVQQKLLEPNGDYLLNRFSVAKLNPKVGDSAFEQKLPKGVDIQQIK